MDGSPIWSLGEIVIDAEHPDSHGVHWILTKEEGFWAAPKTGAELHPHLSRHGAIRTPGWKAERTITLEGHAFAPDFPTLRRASDRLTGMLSDPHEPTPLVCYSEIGPQVCDVFLDDQILTKPGESAVPSFEWSLQLVAPDPRRFGLHWSRALTELPSEGTVGVRFGDGLDFSHGVSLAPWASSGTMRLHNPGTAPTAPMFTLHGPLVRPTLTIRERRPGALTYGDNIAAGEHVVIDPAAPRVLLNGRTPVRHVTFPADFEQFVIPPGGELCVHLDHNGDPDATGVVEAAWRLAWF